MKKNMSGLQREDLWFLAEVVFSTEDSEKLYIVNPICRMMSIIDGIDYIERNPAVLKERRMIAIINGDGEAWVYHENPVSGKQDHFTLPRLILETGEEMWEMYYENREVLLPLCDDALDDPEEQRYGKIHHTYQE